MVAHARRLAALAPNIAIKVPATATGLVALEELAAASIRTNATVCFSVAQAVACAEAAERGLARARTGGAAEPAWRPVVTIMVGRLDDQLQRCLERDTPLVDPGCVHWAGVAAFKAAHTVFQQRGYRSRLLSAAYRHRLHWSELVGPDIVQSIPYKWWKRFDASDHEPRATLQQPVAPEIQGALTQFPDFRAATDPGGLAAAQFATWGPSVHTLQQFLSGMQQLIETVRQRMFR
jgi:transaldolase